MNYGYFGHSMKSKTLTVYIISIILFITSLFFYSCGASSTVRYDRNKEEKKEEVSEKKTYKENFNIIPYRTEINIKERIPGEIKAPDLNPWYGYETKDTSTVQERAIVGTTNGFRVQVMATDNLEEADSLKTELSLELTQKNVYVIFDPPFYKVEVGDFTSMSDAKDLNFKLNQMGYTETRVIASTVNIFE
jgi:hypothetical protein